MMTFVTKSTYNAYLEEKMVEELVNEEHEKKRDQKQQMMSYNMTKNSERLDVNDFELEKFKK